MTDTERKPGEERFPAQAHLDPEARAAQKRRNVWLGIALLAFVVLVGLTTFLKLSTSEGKADFYYNMKGNKGDNGAPALPPGMSPDQAAPPPNLSAEPSVPEAPETATEEPEE